MAMLERPLGAAGLTVSVLGLGAGRIGGPEIGDRDVDRLVGRALDAGVTLIDTARSYGASEERLGRALAGRRDRVVLSTKLGYGVEGVPDWTGPTITRGVDDALRRLGTDRLDIAHLHSCDRAILERGDVVAALLAATRAGKVRVAAYSGEGEALAWALGSGAFAAVQCSVSPVDQGGLDGALEVARTRGVGVLAKRPLGNAPWRFAERPVEPDLAEAHDRFRALALDAGDLDWAELFTRFSAFAPGVSAVLVGTASPVHLERAAAAIARGPLPGEVTQRLREAWRRVGNDWGGRT
jgi:aryl-alcohol dehydrogenase-like predicted oxidoreductase